MLLKHFYNDLASSVLRNDFTLYMVLGYLLLFRLDELEFGEFRRLTSSEDPTKMAQLLGYLTDWKRVEVYLSCSLVPNDLPDPPTKVVEIQKRICRYRRRGNVSLASSIGANTRIQRGRLEPP